MVTHLKFEGTYNLRELGGYALANGERTAEKVLLRAGNLDQLPQASQEALLDYGVKTIIDLRDEWEAKDYPNVFAQSTKVKYHNIPLIGEAVSEDENFKQYTKHYASLAELYGKYLERCQSQIAKIFTAIAESEATVVIHCYAGKDRTGIIAALVLGAVGVSVDLIADDYSQSKAQIGHLIDKWRNYAGESLAELERFEMECGSDAATMIRVFETIKMQYGTVKDYLLQCGVEESSLNQLRALLIRAEN